MDPHNTSDGYHSDHQSGFFAVAGWCAALSLFVAPFRSSAGIRAGLLVLAAILIAIDAGRRLGWRGVTTTLLPPRSIATDAIVVWLAVALAWTLASQNFAASIVAFKGDVLTPLLAGAVFYALTRSANDVRRWSVALVAGLALLLITFFVDPFQQNAAVPRPWYGGVGPVSTWIVTAAALLPLIWVAQTQPRGLMPALAVLALLLIAAIGFLSGNRTVWVSLAAMLLTFALLLWRRRWVLSPARILLFLAFGMALIALLFVESRQWRFEGVVDKAALNGFEWHDNRIALWREAAAMAAERPLAGRGFGREVVEPELVARFSDPFYRGIFLQGHNLVLNYALQMGIAGIVAILALFAGLASTFRTAHAGRDGGQRSAHGSDAVAGAAAISGLLLIVGVFCKNLTDDFFIRQNAILFWAIVGMLWGLRRGKQQSSTAADGPFR